MPDNKINLFVVPKKIKFKVSTVLCMHVLNVDRFLRNKNKVLCILTTIL